MLNAPQKRKKTTVLLVDDHALLRRGLADLIKYEPDLEVIGEAADGEAAIAAAEAAVAHQGSLLVTL